MHADRVSPTAVLHTSTHCKLQHITAGLNNKVDRCSRPTDKSDQNFMTNFYRFFFFFSSTEHMHADNHVKVHVQCKTQLSILPAYPSMNSWDLSLTVYIFTNNRHIICPHLQQSLLSRRMPC